MPPAKQGRIDAAWTGLAVEEQMDQRAVERVRARARSFDSEKQRYDYVQCAVDKIRPGSQASTQFRIVSSVMLLTAAHSDVSRSSAAMQSSGMPDPAVYDRSVPLSPL